ncbi:MAG TPA: DoxX family protein [Myxococcales bacterium]|nr:DoxX family protein [Myxococcales bacterium]
MDQQVAGNGVTVGVLHPQDPHRVMGHPRHHDQAAAALAVAEMERAQDADRHRLESRRELAYLLGRMFMGALFLVSAGAKTLRFGDTLAALRGWGMDDAHLLLPLAIAVEVIGALFLLAGYKVRRVAVGLSVYLAIITFLVSFNLADSVNANSALSNLGFVAGLLMLAAHGAGRASVDAAVQRRNDRRFSA